MASSEKTRDMLLVNDLKRLKFETEKTVTISFQNRRKIGTLIIRIKAAGIMRDSNSNATKQNSTVQCVEILISKTYISNNSNLLWTLSVYSLENQPVRKNRTLHNSEVFHFMVYDWSRTIKQLLETRQIPYSIIQFFSPDNLYSDQTQEEIAADNEPGIDLLSVLDNVSYSGGTIRSSERQLEPELP